MTEETNVTEEQRAKIERVNELSAKIAEGSEENPLFITTEEGQALVDEITRLTGKKKGRKSTVDPKLKKEKEDFKIYLYGEDGESGAQASTEEKLNAYLNEEFPLLSEKGASVQVRFKLKGIRGGGGSRSGAPRITHRKADGSRFIDTENGALNSQGLPSLKVLTESYPDEAEEIVEKLGDAEKRRKLWEESGQDTSKVYHELADGTKLTLQS